VRALRVRLLELVASGADVVLDFSFWSRRMREDYRDLLEPTGVVPETVYLATDRETVWSGCGPAAAATRTTSCSRRGSSPVLRPLRAADAGRGSAHGGALAAVVAQTGVMEALDESAYVGLPLEAAVSKGEREGWYVRVVREDSILTMDLRTDRLNLRVDDDDVVVGAETY